MEKNVMLLKSYLIKIIITLQIILISSFQLNGQNKFYLSTKKEAAILGAGGALVLISLLIENKQSISSEEIYRLNKNTINFFDRSATNYYSKKLSQISDILVISSISLPLSFLLIDETQNDITSIGILYLETLSITYGITNFTKNFTQRYRPYAYNSNVPLAEKLDLDTKKSFFSGHSSTAFASVIFFSTIYSEYTSDEKSKKLVWAGSLTLASSVGLLRYFSGKHFPTDIIAGAIVGGLIGYVVPRLHRNNSTLSLSLPAGSNLISFRYYLR